MDSEIETSDTRIPNSLQIPDQESPPNMRAPGVFLLGGIGTGLVGWLRRRRVL